MSRYEIEIVGGGKMGTAMLAGFIANGLADNTQIAVVETNQIQKEMLMSKYIGVDVIDQPVDCSTLILAVKPNIAAEVIESVNANDIQFDRVISTMAGITTDYLSAKLRLNSAIIRSMPNTPAMVAEGMIAIAPGPNCTDEDLAYTSKALSVLGDVVIVSEDKMDAVTAISGSGPAYLFYFTEALIRAGIQLGLDDLIAYKLAVKTMVGAAALMDQTDSTPAELRQAVTSKGGTTQAALESFTKDDLFGLVVRAAEAASDRSKQLGFTLK